MDRANFTAQGSPLHIAAGLLNEGQPPVCLDDGTFVVPVEIGGSIAYYRDHATAMEPSAKPVPGVSLDLLDPFADMDPDAPQQTPIELAISGCDGTYSFPALMPIRNYQVTPHKTSDFGGSIDPFDAALNAQQVVGLTTLTLKQRMAADATGNGTLSSLDSARIAQLAVGLITQLPVAANLDSDWAFVPMPQAEPNQGMVQPFPPAFQEGSILFAPIVESAEGQDFMAILFGDVSGNWQPPGCGPAPAQDSAQSSLQAPSAPAGVGGETLRRPSGNWQPPGCGPAPVQQGVQSSLQVVGGTLGMPSLTPTTGDLIRVPITATGVAGAVSFYLDMRFDPSVVSLVRVEAGGAASGFNLTTNSAEQGRVRLALFRATPLVTSGEVAVAVFQVIGKSGSSTHLQLSDYTVNEGNIVVTGNDGMISVGGHGGPQAPQRPRKKK